MQTMRFAEGYAPPSRLRPDSIGLTVLTTGLFVSGLFFLNPTISKKIEKVLTVENIPLPKPTPQPTQKPVERQKARPETDRIVTPQTDHVVKVDKTVAVHFDPPPTTPTFPETGDGAAVEPVKPVPPIMVGPSVDPRYASNFQPAYPANEIRGGNAGRVTVRVLIGVDGRVKDIEKVSAASDSFWEATRRQALAKWRFKPATRDGIPYETWKTMNVSFVLNQDQ